MREGIELYNLPAFPSGTVGTPGTRGLTKRELVASLIMCRCMGNDANLMPGVQSELLQEDAEMAVMAAEALLDQLAKTDL